MRRFRRPYYHDDLCRIVGAKARLEKKNTIQVTKELADHLIEEGWFVKKKNDEKKKIKFL